MALPLASFGAEAVRPSYQEALLIRKVTIFLLTEMADYEKRIEDFLQDTKDGRPPVKTFKKVSFGGGAYVGINRLILLIRMEEIYTDIGGAEVMRWSKEAELALTKESRAPDSPLIEITIKKRATKFSYGPYRISMAEFKKAENSYSPQVFDFTYKLFDILH